MTLPHKNSTALLSSTASPALASDGTWFRHGYPYFCWDIKVPEGMKLSALCRFHKNDQEEFFVYIFSDYVVANHLNPFVPLIYPQVVYSPGDNLQIVVYGDAVNEMSMTCNVDVIPDNTRAYNL